MPNQRTKQNVRTNWNNELRRSQKTDATFDENERKGEKERKKNGELKKGKKIP